MPRFKTSDVADQETQRCSFADLALAPPLLQSLREMGCEHPSPVQMRTIPAALAGSDVIVQAKSGTGKTIAFCSVLLQLSDTSKAQVQGLALAPTREIAIQVADEIRRLGWYVRPALSIACFIGGVPVEEDRDRIAQSIPHVVVGSPGRTLKLLRAKQLQTSLRCLVLDEADKLLEPHFRDDITSITEIVFNDSLQFIAVSATFPPPLVTAAENLFVHVEKKRAKRGQPITRELAKQVFLCTSAVKKNGQGLAMASSDHGGAVLESAVLKGVLHFRRVVQGHHVKQKFPAVLDVLTTTVYQQAFVFCNDSNRATQIAEMLSQAGVPAAASSGRMDQSWRTQAFVGLKRCTYRVLVCTDLMARGIDVESVDIIVNLDLPEEKETYLHRSGRTARFGSIGCAINIVFEGDEDQHLQYFQMQLGFELSDYSDREAAITSRLHELISTGGLVEGTDALMSAAAAETPSVEPSPSQQNSQELSGHQVHVNEEEEYDYDEDWEEEVDVEEDEEEEEVEVEEEDEDSDAAAVQEEAAETFRADGKSEQTAVKPRPQQDNLLTLPEAPPISFAPCEVPRARIPARSAAAPYDRMPVGGQPGPSSSHAAGCGAETVPAPSPASLLAALAAAAEPYRQALSPQPAATPAFSGLPLHMLAPPVLFSPGGLQLPAGIEEPMARACLPEWQPWMLHCGTYAEYAARCPGAAPLPIGSLGTARGRLEALWAHHCRVWTAA